MLHLYQRFPAAYTIDLGLNLGSSKNTDSDVILISNCKGHLGAGIEFTQSISHLIWTPALKASPCSRIACCRSQYRASLLQTMQMY